MPDHEYSRRLPGRASLCANASLQAEIERVRSMSVEDRILSALAMGSKFTWLQPTAIKKNGCKPS